MQLAGVLGVGLAGCAPQATTEYEGDSLFTMNGRVELALDESSGSLIPALAFIAPGSDEVHIVDTDVSGEFPAGFQIDVYAPPPEAVVRGPEHELDANEPRYSIGFIAAVAEDHLPMLYLPGSTTGTDEEEICDETGCTLVYESKTHDKQHTGRLTVFCPPDEFIATPSGAPSKCVILDRSGDPILLFTATDPMFAGAANDHAVIYLDAPAPAGGTVAERFGAPEGLDAGYHLMSLAPFDRMNPMPLQLEPDPQPEETVVDLQIQPGLSFVLAVFGGA